MTYETNYFVLTVSEPEALNTITVLQPNPNKPDFHVMVYRSKDEVYQQVMVYRSGDEVYQQECNGLTQLISTLRWVQENYS